MGSAVARVGQGVGLGPNGDVGAVVVVVVVVVAVVLALIVAMGAVNGERPRQ